jgi:LmbE family N-acetylglucosaminyl deacetylase
METAAGRIATLLCLLVPATGCAGPEPAREGAELLVFAPHPDDETLGCSGVILQALKRGERVRIALFTNGDGFPAAASLVAGKPVASLREADFLELARFRQEQSRTAFRALGGTPESLVFLGYPDSGLTPVYDTRGSAPFRQRFTGMSGTYGMAQRDYRSSRHGRPAPYTYEAVLSDVVELIRSLRPARILVTHEADRHPDHQAAFRFVRDAVAETGYSGAFEAYLIHGGPEWPWPPGMTPDHPFAVHEFKGKTIPLGVPWPPSRRVALSPEEARAKEQAIRAQASHLPADAEGPMKEEKAYLESFVKSEEVFWRIERR